MLNFQCIDSHVEIHQGELRQLRYFSTSLSLLAPFFFLAAILILHAQLNTASKSAGYYIPSYISSWWANFTSLQPQKQRLLQCIAAASPFFNSTRNILPPSRDPHKGSSPARIPLRSCLKPNAFTSGWSDHGAML